MLNVDNAPNNTCDGARPNIPSQPQNDSESRNRNLDILKAYIQRQRTLLERIKQDVDRLRALKPALDADPSSALSHILHVDSNDNSEKGGENQDATVPSVGKVGDLVSQVHGVGEATITKHIDWNSFRTSDVTPLHSLQSRSRSSLIPSGTHPHGVPPLTPSTPSLISSRSSLGSFLSLDYPFEKKLVKRDESTYQIHVREERIRLVDPALTIAAEFLASLPPDSDDECVKQARVKDAHEAKETKAKEVKDARKVKLQNGKANNPRGASNCHFRKSAHRRKSEASAAAAASRPRGQGGRFKKKEPVMDATLVPGPGVQTQIERPSASISAAISNAPPSSGHTLVSPNGCVEGGRPQRMRKPSIRFGSAVASSASSIRSTRTGSSASTERNGHVGADYPSSSPVAPMNTPRGRLTIRIPARVPANSAARDVPEQRDRQVSASTSMTTTSTTESSELMSVAESNTLSGKRYGPIGWPAAVEDDQQDSSPATVTLPASETRLFSVKQEEEEIEDGMDIDSWGALDEHNDRFKHNPTLHSFQASRRVKHDPVDRGDQMDLGEDELDDGKTDFFVPELFTPLPSSATSHATAGRVGINGSANGNTNKESEAKGGSSRRGDPSSKTYNVSWSDEEQRLLDMLLEQYPDGTKNRWANISRAMGGTRTPRQVASRVQKYFAKMKKWGIDLT